MVTLRKRNHAECASEKEVEDNEDSDRASQHSDSPSDTEANTVRTSTVITPTKDTGNKGQDDSSDSAQERHNMTFTSVSDVTKVIASAPAPLRDEGLRRAELLIRRVSDFEAAQSYPEATNLLALMNIIMSSSDFVRQGSSYLQDMNAFVTNIDGDNDDAAKERSRLLGAVNVLLGRSPEDISNVALGDVFIKEAYAQNYGWMLSGSRQYLSTNVDNFCGFSTTFITETVPLSSYAKELVPSEQNKNKELRNKRDDLIVGTAIVVIHAILRDVLRDDPQLFNVLTEKPLSRITALCVAGIKIPRLLKDRKEIKSYVDSFIPALVENLPDWDKMKKRVEAMVAKRRGRGNLSDRQQRFTPKDAVAWLENEKKTPPPPSKKQRKTKTTEKSSEDEVSMNEDKEETEASDKENNEEETGDAEKIEEETCSTPKEDLSTWPGTKVNLTPVDVDSMTFASQGSDDGAATWFTTYTNTKFVDGISIPQDLPANMRPKVEHKPLPELRYDNDRQSPELLVIRNAFSPQVVDAVLGIYRKNGLPFVREDSKAFRAFVCDEAETGDVKASFQMGKNAAARYMRAFNAHEVEKLLANVMESHLRVALKRKYGNAFKFFINSGGVNICLPYHRKGFAWHYDHDAFNTVVERLQEKNIDFVGGKDNAPLPTPKDMVIVTVVLCGPKGAFNTSQENYNLKWRVIGSKQGVVETETGHNDIHIQIGLDEKCEHHGQANKFAFQENFYRVTISLRGYCNPTVNKAAWEERCKSCKLSTSTKLLGSNEDELIRNVLHYMENPHLEAVKADRKAVRRGRRGVVSNSSDTADNTHHDRLPPELLLTDPSNKDSYKNCPWADVPDANKIHRATLSPILHQKQAIAPLYFSWPMQQVLLKNRCIVRLLIYNHGNKEKEKNTIPLIAMSQPMLQSGSGALVLPTEMTWYPKSTMQQLAHVKHTNVSQPIICTEHPLMATSLVLTCKNRIDTTSGADVLLRNAQEFFVYGSGGSSSRLGEAGAAMIGGITAESAAHPWGFSAFPQDTHSNKTNKVLLHCAENCQVLDVWMGYDLVEALAPQIVAALDDDAKRRRMVLHVGRFYCYGEETVEGETSAELGAIQQQHGLDDHLSFRTRQHKIFHLRRIDEKLFRGLYYEDDSEKLKQDWRVITITDRPGEFVDLHLPEGDTLAAHCGVGASMPGGIVATQLWYHYKQRLDPFRDHFMRVDDNHIIPQVKSHERADSKPWIELRNELRKNNPFAIQVNGKRALETKIAIDDWITLQIGLSAAGFYRMKKLSLTPSNLSIPLSDPKFGAIMGMFSFPMPIRDYDLPPLLYGILSQTGFENETNFVETPPRMEDDLLASVICHVFGRASAIGVFYKSLPANDRKNCLRKANIETLIAFINKVVAARGVGMSRLIVHQYENQIPAPLRTSSKAATTFLREFAGMTDYIVGHVLKEGKTRREYVIGLADAMASVVDGSTGPQFYFVAQHIIATLALSYKEGRFGEITLDNVHMGPGSKEALKAIGLLSKRPELTHEQKNDAFDPLSNYINDSEAKLFMSKIMNLRKNQLDALGLMKTRNSVVVKLTGRKFSFLDMEHMLCKLYLFLNKKSPSRMQSVQPNYHLCQCHPARYNTDDLDPIRVQGGHGWDTEHIAGDAKTSFEAMDYRLPWKLQFRSEWDGTPNFNEVPVLDPKLRKEEEKNGGKTSQDQSSLVCAEDGADELGVGLHLRGSNAYYRNA